MMALVELMGIGKIIGGSSYFPYDSASKTLKEDHSLVDF